MNIIVCLDNKNGMMFHNRRQSTDRKLRDHMLRFLQKKTLWMSPYSAGQFSELPENVCVSEQYLSLAAEQDYCFVENGDWLQFLPQVRSVVVYRWNRVYPSDLQFPASELLARNLVSCDDFVGFSHDRITQEVYVL